MNYLGMPVQVQCRAAKPCRLSWGNPDEAALKKSLAETGGQPGGYALAIGQSGIGIAADDEAGLRHGTQSLLQLIEQSAGGELPRLTVVDWPDFPFRGFHACLRPPGAFGQSSLTNGLAVYEWMIRRLARYKYNYLCLMLKDGMALRCRPDLGFGPWTESEVRQLIAFARLRGITVFPEVKTLGKFLDKAPAGVQERYAPLFEPQKYIGQLDWQGQYHKGFKAKVERLEAEERALQAEKGKQGKLSGDFKIADPAVFEFIAPILDEVAEVFEHPPFFHLGCDESFYTAIGAPPAERGKILAAYINRMAAYVQQKGATAMIWDDMLISHKQFPCFFEAHGGPPLDTWRAVDHLNTNIVMASWHYGYTVGGHYPDRYPMIGWLAQKGFRTIGVPWYKIDGIVNVSRDVKAGNGLGLMGSSWSIHMAVGQALGGKFNEKTEAKHELNVFAATAEAAWSPLAARAALIRYAPETWEKNFIPKAMKK